MQPPYDPVIRHTHEHGYHVCRECAYDLLNTPCEKDWCACTCRNAEVSNPGESEGQPPIWVVTPAPNAEGWWKKMNPATGEGFPPEKKPSKTKIQEFIARWEVHFAVATVLVYILTLVLVVVVFPDVSNLWVSVFILITGFTTSMMSLATVLKTREP